MTEVPNKAATVSLDEATLKTYAEMKAATISRPYECPEAVWENLVLPRTGAEIARYQLQAQLRELSAGIVLPKDHKGMLTALVPLAVEAIVDVLTHPRSKGSEKLQAASFLIDHDLGKAKQEVEHSGSLALEIRKQADEYIRSRPPTTPPIEMDMVTKAADDLVKEYMPQKYVVGKKAGSDEQQG